MKTSPIFIFFLLIGSSVFFAGCGEKKDEFAPPVLAPAVSLKNLGFDIELDPALAPVDQTRLAKDVSRIKSIQLGGTISTPFQQVFGGTQSSDVVRFINERVHYIIPQSVDAFKRLRRKPAATSSHATVVALNMGTQLWLGALAAAEPAVQFQFADRWVDVTSSRVGIIQLGPGYGDKLANFVRMGTLIHEARHSDCTGGITRDEIAMLSRPGGSSPATCGHEHVLCPDDMKELVNKAACDDRPWGAYAVGWIYNLEVALNCVNCSASELQIAKVAALDSRSRLLDITGMTSPDSPVPDMTSSGIVDGQPAPSNP